ncbi:hypothetical protein ACFV29_44095 [Streptomyces sp. NPDC059690]|uniref:hypothetical protein n=1 Tax=Streptomyces sp. NPDC059690 TaxID=3346907 RepID=UPI0036C33120
MKGQHTPGNIDRRPGPRTGDEPDRGRSRAARTTLRVVLVLVGLVGAALLFVLVRDLVAFDDAVRHPRDGFSDWQCASRSGTCDP